MVALNPQVWWYVARAAGIVAWALLAAAVLLGLTLSTRVLGRRPAPAWLLDLHRALGGLAVVFTGVHLLGIVADTYIEFDVLDVLIPFAATWRPAAVAAGVVSLYVLLAVQVTSLAKRRLSHRSWRRVHLASYPLYALATAHLLAAGTDTTSTVLMATVLVSMVMTATLTFVRLFVPRVQRARRPGQA